MATEPNQDNITLPEALRAQFEALRHRLWKVETGRAVGVAATALIASFLFTFFSDRLWNTPGAVRFVFLGAGLAFALAAVAYWFFHWFVRPRDLRRLSVLVQKRFRRLGDRLLGIVELADPHCRPAHFSPDLYQAAIRQVAEDAMQYDFREAVSRRSLQQILTVLAGFCFLALLAAAVLPQTSWNALQRWSRPFSDIPRHTLVELTGFPNRLVVPHGEGFEVQGRVNYRSFWKPDRVQVQYGNQKPFHAAVQGNTISLQVPGQMEPAALKVEVGDSQTFLHVEPTHRPSLRKLTAAIELPEYLRHPSRQENVVSGNIVFPESSRIALEASTSRALSFAWMTLDTGEQIELAVEGDTFRTESRPWDNVLRARFRWVDTLGLSNASPWEITFNPRPDQPPRPELRDLPRSMAVLESEVIELKTAGRDDFGIQHLGIEWSAFTPAETNAIPMLDLMGTAPDPTETLYEKRFYFSPSILGVPSDATIELQVFATDYKPDRPRVRTPVYRILVIGLERHAEMIRQNLESLMTRLEEITRLEEKIAEETSDVAQMDSEQLESDATGEQLDQIREEQDQNSNALQEMAREGMQTLREAMRNPNFPSETMQQWTDQLQTMQELAQGPMQQASQTLQSAQQNSEQRAQDVTEALQQQREILEQLAELQKKANERLDNLQALTLAQRLRKVGDREKEIGERLLKMAPETVGLLPEELPDRLSEVQKLLSSRQTTTVEQTDTLQTEISRFYERTQRLQYGQVSRAMQEAETVVALSGIQQWIERNIGLRAAQDLHQWSGRFHEWADLLQPQEDSSGSGSGSGSQGEQVDLTEELMALLRLRERELNIRERTRLLSEQSEEEPSFQAAAQTLSGQQSAVRQELQTMGDEIPVAVIAQVVIEASRTAEAAEDRLSIPQADEGTDRVQTETVRLVSDAINLINEQSQSSQGSQGSSSQQQQMAFLLQMMGVQPGMRPGQQPGANMSGGTTDQVPGDLTREGSGGKTDSREVRNASGFSGGVPSEFREALENYYRSMEENSPAPNP